MTKREEVYLNAGGRCEMCGRPLALDEMTLDHTKAQASFGKGEVRNDIENLACFCRECNAAKADMTPKEFRRFVNTRKAELNKTGGGKEEAGAQSESPHAGIRGKGQADQGPGRRDTEGDRQLTLQVRPFP